MRDHVIHPGPAGGQLCPVLKHGVKTTRLVGVERADSDSQDCRSRAWTRILHARLLGLSRPRILSLPLFLSSLGLFGPPKPGPGSLQNPVGFGKERQTPSRAQCVKEGSEAKDTEVQLGMPRHTLET